MRWQVAVFRTMMTWFLLHNKIHEAHEVSGVGNGMYKVTHMLVHCDKAQPANSFFVSL